MEKILALVHLTYKESIRKKIFLIILLFTLCLIGFSALFPVVSPSDRIKLIQIWSLRGITFFGVIMAIFLTAVSIPEDMEDKRFHTVFTKPITKESFIVGKLLGFITVMALFVGLMGIISLVYLQIVNALTLSRPDQATTSLSSLRARLKAQKFGFAPYDSPRGVIVGSFTPEESPALEVHLSGAVDDYAYWQFKGLEAAKSSGEPIRAEIKMRLGEGALYFASNLVVGVRMSKYDPVTKKSESVLSPLTELKLKYNQPVVVEINRGFIDQSGTLELFIKRTNPESYIVATPESVQIFSGPKSFTWNFLKVLGLLFFQITLMITIMVMGSTFLSSGVNIFLGVFIYFCGSGMGFFQESLQKMEQTIRYAARIQLEGLPGHHVASETFPLWMMKTSKLVCQIAFKLIPDFSIFNGSSYLVKDTVVPESLIVNALGYLIPYGMIALVIAWLCFRTREFK